MRSDCSQISLIALGLLLSGANALAAPLGTQLKLPAYFNKKYGAMEVRERISGNGGASLAFSIPKLINSGKEFRLSSELVFTLPAGLSRAARARLLANEFLKLMRQKDEHYQKATLALVDMGMLSADHKVVQLNMLERVERYVSARLSGETPSADRIASLWWNLKFSAQVSDPAREVREGDLVILGVHQYGYFEKSNSFLTNARRKLDFGHSALAIRHVGQGPENDVFVNDGSKDLNNKEVTLPNKLDPNVPNMVDVSSLWRWTEVQLYKRYMKVAVRPYVLSPLQARALGVLLPKLNGVTFGPAIAFSNNCADAAAKMLNFLLPIEKTFGAKTFVGIATPSHVLKEAAGRFGGKGEIFRFPNVADQNPGDETPPIAYQDVNYPDLSALKSYQDYRAWEREWLDRVNAR